MSHDHTNHCQSSGSGQGDGSSMTCQECVDFLMDYLDQQLPAQQKVVFDAHLDKCPQCRVFIDNYRLTTTLIDTQRQAASGDTPTSAALPESLVQAILKAQRENPSA